MKKIFSLLMVFVLSFSTMSTVFGQGNNTTLVNNAEDTGINIKENEEYKLDDILALEPYVFVENGHFKIDSNEAIENGIDLALIQGQQKYFNHLNQQADNGELVISQNLAITDLKTSKKNSGITTFATCKGITKGPVNYWWGHKTWANSCDTKKLISDANTAAASGGIAGSGAGVIGVFFPIVLVPAGVAALTGSYFYLFATRLDANNNGKGVIVEMTWAAVFDITPQ